MVLFENMAKILFEDLRSFSSAEIHQREGKVCVLNFACLTDPGGGIEVGSDAQEEGLCRCSTLFPCLKDRRMHEEY